MLSLASLVLSLAALIVAVLSVYVVSLRHANIEVDVARVEINHSSRTGHVPTGSVLQITLLASNDGARAGLLEAIRVHEVRTKPNVAVWGPPQGTGMYGASQLPVVLQANEARSFAWSFPLPNYVAELPEVFEEFVSNVERLASAEVGVQWWYHRSSGLPFPTSSLPVWLRRGRRREMRRLVAAIDVDRYRASLAATWRDCERPDLAKRMEASRGGSTRAAHTA
jgi:hypothetical protein